MISNETIEQIAISAYTSHRDAYISMKQKWNDLYSRYENDLRDGSITSKTESKVCLGAAFSLVENAIPRILGRDPKYKYMGREGDDENIAELYEQFSEYQFDSAGAREEIRKTVKWGLITGLAGWKMGWEEKKRIVSKDGKEILGSKTTNPLFVSFLNKIKVGKTVKVEEIETEANYTFTAIKPHDLIWSVNAMDTKDCSVLGHADRMTIGDLKKAGFNVDGIVMATRSTDYWMNQLKLNDGVSESEKIVSIEKGIEMTEIEIAELYVNAMNDQGVVESYVTWIGNIDGGSMYPMKTVVNPYDKKFTPVGIFRPIDRVGKFYGFGIIEPSLGVINAEEDTLNIALEAQWTATVPPVEYNPSNIIDLASLSYGPRSLNAVRNLGQSMAVMPTPQVNVGATQVFLEFLNRGKQNVSGITDFQTGADQVQGQKTLGEIQIKTQESNARIGQMLGNLERQLLEPMGKYALYMNKQFLTDKMLFRIVGKKGQFMEKKISKKNIEAIKDVVIVGGSSAMVIQQQELQKWVAIINQANLEAQSVNPVKINKLPMWKRLFEEGLLIKDPDTYLPSLKEIEEQEMGDNVLQLNDAKEENANPITARVLPTDVASIHIPIHKAEIERRQRELEMAQQAGIETPEDVLIELQLLVKHLDDHIISVGSPVPDHSANMQVGQGNPSMQPNVQQTPQS